MFDITPVVSPKPTDCGATCLKMLINFYGFDAPIEQLIKECNTGIAGCTGKDLVKAGRLHYMNMMSYKMDAEELVNQDRPAIVWWMYNHFVVFAGKDENGKIVICNPDKGRYRVSLSVFKSFYSGISFWNGEPHDLVEGAAE